MGELNPGTLGTHPDFDIGTGYPMRIGGGINAEAQGAIAGTTIQRVNANAAAYAPSWRTLQYQDTPLNAAFKERLITSLGASAASTEISRVDTTGQTVSGLAGKYFTLADEDGPVYVWFDANNASTDPAPPGYREIEVDLTSALQEVQTIDTVGQTAAGMQNDYVTLADTSGAVYAWFNYNAAGVDPAPGGREIEIALATTDTTPELIAAKIQAAFEADAQYTATVLGTVVTITDIATGTRTNLAAGTSTLTVATTVNGTAGAAMTAGDIATAIKNAVDADSKFIASVLSNVVTITASSTGPRQDITPGDTTIDTSVLTQGAALDSFPLLADYDEEPETQALIITYYQIVDASAILPPTATRGLIQRYKHIDKWRSMQITECYFTPPDRTEQRFAAQPFPALFRSFYHNAACGVMLNSRGAFSAMVETRIEISYGAFEAVSGLTLLPNSFAIANFRVGDTLNDAFTLSSSEAGCSYTIAIPASSPSVSTYQAYGTTKQLVSGESVLWKAGIYRTTKLYVRMI